MRCEGVHATHLCLAVFVFFALFFSVADLGDTCPVAPCIRQYNTVLDSDGIPVHQYRSARPAQTLNVPMNRTLPALRHLLRHTYASTNGSLGVVRSDNPLWFDSDDTFRALEVLILPGVFEHFRDTAEAMLRYVHSVSQDGVLRRGRRREATALSIDSMAPKTFSVHNSMVAYYGDVTKQYLRSGLCREDGREIAALRWQGFKAAFRMREAESTAYSSDDDGATSEIHLEDGIITVLFTATLRSNGADLAHIACRHTIRPNTPLTNVSITVTNLAATPLRDIQVTIVRSYLEDATYRRVCRKQRGEEVVCNGKGQVQEGLAVEGLEWFSVLPEARMGEAYGHHVLCRDATLQGVRVVEEWNRIARVETVYGVAELAAGAAYTATEVSLLTRGGLYGTMPYAALFARIESETDLTDASLATDYGAALSSVASFAYFAKKGAYNTDASSAAHLAQTASLYNTWCLDHLEAYTANFLNGDGTEHTEVSLRSHSYVLIATIKLALSNKGTPHYAGLVEKLRLFVDVLLGMRETQKGAAFYACSVHERRWMFLDCHGAALLALSYMLTTSESLDYHIRKVDVFTHINDAMRALVHHSTASASTDPTPTTHLPGASPPLHILTTLASLNNKDGLMQTYKAGILLRAMHHYEEAVRHQGIKQDYATENVFFSAKYAVYTALAGALQGAGRDEGDRGDRGAVAGEEEEHVFLSSHKETAVQTSEAQVWCMLGYFREYEQLYYAHLSKGSVPMCNPRNFQ